MGEGPASARRGAFAAVLAVLTATGWAANHFAAVLPVLRDAEGLAPAVVDGVFGVYAVGLLPGLFLGGAVSDRVGRAVVVLPGALVALIGSLLLASWHDTPGLFAGRLVVGLGAGLAIGAGTAWAADLRGAAGTVLAGVFLTTGFGLGPLVSGILAELLPAPEVVPFVVSAVLSAVAVTAALVLAGRTGRPGRVGAAGAAAGSHAATVDAGLPADLERSAGTALGWALPMALWVFASVTVSVVTVPARLPDDLVGPLHAGPVLAGLAAALALGSGIAVQALARRRSWGPRAGVAGSGLAAAGFLLVSLGGADVGLPLAVVACVVTGTAYGLCLREGLLDLEALAPRAVRGLLTGLFYVVTYLGFGLPVLLVVLEPAVGTAAPTLVLAAAAAAVALARGVRLRRSAHRATSPTAPAARR